MLVAGVYASRTDQFVGEKVKKVKTHDNQVAFSGATAVKFNMTYWDITRGQPSSQIPCSGIPCGDLTTEPGNCCLGNTLCFRAGRKASTGPSSGFKNSLTLLNALGLSVKKWTVLPKDLNFVAIGTISFTFPNGNVHQCPDIRLGEGSANVESNSTYGIAKNNWWIGSPHCVGGTITNNLDCTSFSEEVNNCSVSLDNGPDDHTFIVTEHAVQ
jgi:hypothetical protein